MNPETKFKNKVMKRLKATPDCYVFVKEALGLRGIPDIVGCYKGTFFAFELKKCLKDTNAKTGRIVQQRHNIHKIIKAGGFSTMSCPETWEDDYKLLLCAVKTCDLPIDKLQ